MTRPPHVAGMFYPGKPVALRDMIDALALEAAADITGTVLGIISPHAGYQYSGVTAAHSFLAAKTLAPEAAVIIAPSHQEYFDGISVFPGDAYSTPLGDVPVETYLRDSIAEQSQGLIEPSMLGHGPEHAIEVQLPYLQRLIGPVPIVPIVMGDQERRYCFPLGRILGESLRGRNVLLIASSDLSHFYPAETADRIDRRFIDDVERFDEERLMTDLEEGQVEACGGGPVVALMAACRALGADSTAILHHCNSGDRTGDRRKVVGYLSAALFRRN